LHQFLRLMLVQSCRVVVTRLILVQDTQKYLRMNTETRSMQRFSGEVLVEELHSGREEKKSKTC